MDQRTRVFAIRAGRHLSTGELAEHQAAILALETHYLKVAQEAVAVCELVDAMDVRAAETPVSFELVLRPLRQAVATFRQEEQSYRTRWDPIFGADA